MLYAFTLMDGAGVAELRQQIRPAHKAHLAEVQERIAFAGPLVCDGGMTMQGSLLVMDFPNRQSAQEWLDHEPFVKAGVLASTSMHAFVNL